MILPREIKKHIEVQVAALWLQIEVADNGIYLSVRAVVKPIEVISDCLYQWCFWSLPQAREASLVLVWDVEEKEGSRVLGGSWVSSASAK